MPCWMSCFGKSSDPPEIVELDYRHSNLLEVPSDVFTHERTLEKLSLASNQINDLPPSLFHCHELRELELYDNELQAIPAAIGSLTRLTRLDVSRNAITEVADTIKNCKSLSHVNLSLNHLVKVPEGISQLVGLEELNLTDTCLEYLSANFGRLTKLRVLELRENLLQSLPKSMTRFSHLSRLDLGHNDLHDIPEVIATMTSLTEIFVDNNSIRSIPKFIGNLTKLTSFDCSNNDIYEVADDICKCTHLADLNLTFNNISGLPDGLGQLEALTVLRIDNNQIQYLPEKFGQLRNLQEFSAIHNSLKALPPSIGLLRKIHTMMLDENLLSELPKEIGSCTQLSILHVSKNRLSSIPSEVGHLTNLKVLSIAGNFLQHLPVSIVNIPKLGAIWISETQSKPLLPLNKEIDSSTGQFVLTCFLLPQLAARDEESKLSTDELDRAENATRHRQCTIKFADMLEEVGVGDSLEDPTPGTSHKTHGLSRAPTPYPKELRALAKHASQVYTRHTKEVNGDVIRKDGASYESDLESENNLPGYSGRVRFHKLNGNSDNISINREESERLLSQHTTRETEFRSSVQYDSIRRLRLGQGGAGHDPGAPMTNVGENESSATSHQWNSHGTQNADMTAKTPPPYHIAARRAAFFRSTSAGSGSMNGNSRSSALESPIPPIERANTPAFAATNSPLTPSIPSSNSHVRGQPVLSVTNDQQSPGPEKQTFTNLNMTFTKDSPKTPQQHNTTFSVRGSEVSNSVQPTENSLDSTFTVVTDVSGSAKRNQTPLDPSPPTSEGRSLSEMVEMMKERPGPVTYEQEKKEDTEKRIIETIIRDGSAFSNSLTSEDIESMDSSDGPPVLPMRPIVRDYTQLRSQSVSGLSQRSSTDVSKIPIFAMKIPEPVSNGKETTRTYPLQVIGSYSAENPKLVTDLTHSTSVGQFHPNQSQSNNSGNTVNTNTMQDFPLKPSAGSENMPGMTILSGNRPEPVRSPPPTGTVAMKHPISSNIPTFRSSFGKTGGAPPAQQGFQRNLSDSPSGILAPGTVATRVTKLTKQSQSQPDLPMKKSNMVRQNSKGSKIPMRKTPSPPPETITNGSGEFQQGKRDGLQGPHSISTSKFTVLTSKKPWIFGSHRNTRVVPLEYKKVNELGFTISNSGAPEPGAYIDSIEDPESSVRPGDKLLEVDGIDVSKMNLEIVNKILSNCQETMNLLVSREN